MTKAFVSTSIARRLMTRMEVTHERARISVFSGPPGIGKTTAIDAWRQQHPGQVAVVKVEKRNAGETLVLQHCLDSMRRLRQKAAIRLPAGRWELRVQIFNAVCDVSGLNPAEVRRNGLDGAATKPVSIVFDEAQNLSRAAIEALRYWCDADRCYAPYPLGLIFVGNSEFSLASATGSESVISAAVADRALYIQSLDYDELTDADMTMVIEAQGVVDPAAVAVIVRAFRGPRTNRSLRRISDVIDDAREEARGAPVTAQIVREVMGLS